jgi:hypothetical protein
VYKPGKLISVKGDATIKPKIKVPITLLKKPDTSSVPVRKICKATFRNQFRRKDETCALSDSATCISSTVFFTCGCCVKKELLSKNASQTAEDSAPSNTEVARQLIRGLVREPHVAISTQCCTQRTKKRASFSR